MNVVLDLLLIGPLGLGTKGAAVATITAQGISFLSSLVYLKRKDLFHFQWKHFRFRGDMLRNILKVGMPSAVQMAVVNVSYLLITAMLNPFGVAVAAASGIGLKVNTFAGMPCWAVGQAVTAMVGQNMGAGDWKRVKRTVEIGLWVNLAVTGVIAVCVQLWAGPIIDLFDPASPEVGQWGVRYLRICCGVNSLVYAVMYTYDSFAVGVGSAYVAMGNALLDAAVVRLLISWLLAYSAGYGAAGVYIGQALSPVLPALVGLAYYKRGGWKEKKLVFMES